MYNIIVNEYHSTDIVRRSDMICSHWNQVISWLIPDMNHSLENLASTCWIKLTEILVYPYYRSSLHDFKMLKNICEVNHRSHHQNHCIIEINPHAIWKNDSTCECIRKLNWRVLQANYPPYLLTLNYRHYWGRISRIVFCITDWKVDDFFRVERFYAVDIIKPSVKFGDGTIGEKKVWKLGSI